MSWPFGRRLSAREETEKTVQALTASADVFESRVAERLEEHRQRCILSYGRDPKTETRSIRELHLASPPGYGYEGMAWWYRVNSSDFRPRGAFITQVSPLSPYAIGGEAR